MSGFWPAYSKCLFFGIALLASQFGESITANAQSEFTRVYGTDDQSLPVPQSVSATVQKDAAAVQAVLNFVKTVNGSNWTGIQGTGTFTAPNGDTEDQGSASLTIQNSDEFRLDLNASAGERSIRIYGPYGEILESNGVRHPLPATTAMSGLFAFPRLLAATFPDAAMTVLERGMVSIDGQSLHRVTIEIPDLSSESSSPAGDISVIDLYFDPATSLLVKSAVSVQLDSQDRAIYLQVVTYSDYQKVEGILLPFTYSQTLNGQRQWTLQLTSVKTESSLDASYFQF